MRYWVLFLLSAFAAPCFAGVRPPSRAKNVLIIYSDDHTFRALGAMGDRVVQTPNLDRLARSGMLFTQAHVMGGNQGAVCIPSRAMLLTGRYLNRLPGDGGVIPDSLPSLPETLRAKGYTTFHVGKWHSDTKSHGRMFSAGADIFFGGMHHEKEGGQFHPNVYTFNPSGAYPPSAMRKSDTYSSALYADGAIRFLRSPEAKEKPFFCYVAFTSPHDPRTPPPAFEKRYNPADIELPPNFLPEHPFDNGYLNVRDEHLLPRPLSAGAVQKEIALYYGMISELDHQVGRILKALKKNGLHKNTLIVFAGDNGLAVGQHGLLGKQNLYDHSIRVPLMMSGPGIPQGTTYKGLMYLSDIAPTIYDYLGIEKPSTVEGLSHASVFAAPERMLRAQLYNIFGSWMRSIKTAEGYKMILYSVNGVRSAQLFDLNKDPWETRDLSKDTAYKEKMAALRTLLKKEMALAHDPFDLDVQW